MKKILSIILGLSFLMTGIAFSAGPTSATSTSWGVGNTISSAWLNAVGSLLSTITSTSTPLGTISNQSTSTGNLLVASTTSGWVALAVGSNGQCPIASSTASLGIAWGICGGSINGTLASSYYLAASGVGFSVSTNGATTTFTLASSSYLQPLNNLSELTSTSSARVNIGLGNVLNGQQLLAGNNLSDLTNTSTARTSIGYTGNSGQIGISGAGVISFATTSVSQFVNDAGYATSGASAAASPVGGVQFNTNSQLAATSTFTYATSTQVLAVTNISATAITINGQTPTLVQKIALGAPVSLTLSGSPQTIASNTIPAASKNSLYNIDFLMSATNGGSNTTTLMISGTNVMTCFESSNYNHEDFHVQIQMQNATNTAEVVTKAWGNEVTPFCNADGQYTLNLANATSAQVQMWSSGTPSPTAQYMTTIFYQ